jgi:hypothetical protein
VREGKRIHGGDQVLFALAMGGVGFLNINKYILSTSHSFRHQKDQSTKFHQPHSDNLQSNPTSTTSTNLRNGDRQVGSVASLNVPTCWPLSSSVLTFPASFRNAANYVSESVQGATSKASSTANKEVAKDSDASISTRATAAKDAVSDKLDQKSHDVRLHQSSSRT